MEVEVQANGKNNITLKSKLKEKANEYTAWMVKKIFGFEGKLELSHLAIKREWSPKYAMFMLESTNRIKALTKDGFKSTYFLEKYQTMIQALVEVFMLHIKRALYKCKAIKEPDCNQRRK